ncbi:LysR family transcriptional regulator [Phaeacidiphilus oryzae]|uniref:LysR family transcriptional regulator n=1 Tax=Phaeacidiphilus oryzae TaxID=348818 RepID=UPI0005642696|nr:LysR family transcriptional regulator [Phaeacidiphilus oryzae]
MELTAWRTFVTVCRLGSLSAAAVELGYTQSAVSRQIGALERRFGISLIQRHPRGVRPSPAGEVFHRRALAALNEVDRAVEAVRELRDGVPARPLAVGATPSLAAGVVPAAMRRVLDAAGVAGPEAGAGEEAKAPGAVEARPRWSLLPGLSGRLHERVAVGELDLAVVTDAPPGLPDDPRVERRFLGLDEMVVVLPADHPQAGRDRLRITELADQTWAEDNEGSAAMLRRHAARAGVTARVELAAADLPGKLALVATGHAIALMPGVLTGALRADVSAVALVDPPTRGIYAITPSPTATPTARAAAAPHPAAGPLLAELTAAFGPMR